MTYIGIRDMEEKLYTCTEVRYTVVRTSARGVFFGQVGLNLEKLAAVLVSQNSSFF